MKPWDIERLTLDQFERYAAWIDDYQRQQEEAARSE